ncbi:hypothetical protein L218DRAFT_944678 [Marasmius fiardii PR-910]|nr:hypothetical protein L218DRAFT_944678 [Marasmius fiardii PR-910]
MPIPASSLQSRGRVSGSVFSSVLGMPFAPGDFHDKKHSGQGDLLSQAKGKLSSLVEDFPQTRTKKRLVVWDDGGKVSKGVIKIELSLLLRQLIVRTGAKAASFAVERCRDRGRHHEVKKQIKNRTMPSSNPSSFAGCWTNYLFLTIKFTGSQLALRAVVKPSLLTSSRRVSAKSETAVMPFAFATADADKALFDTPPPLKAKMKIVYSCGNVIYLCAGAGVLIRAQFTEMFGRLQPALRIYSSQPPHVPEEPGRERESETWQRSMIPIARVA